MTHTIQKTWALWSLLVKSDVLKKVSILSQEAKLMIGSDNFENDKKFEEQVLLNHAPILLRPKVQQFVHDIVFGPAATILGIKITVKSLIL